MPTFWKVAREFRSAEKLASRFNVSIRTGHEDYRRAMELLKEEQTGTREELLNQLQALRLATVQKALKRGHFQTVATLLGDMGRVIGEAAPEQLALQVPTLDIRIEDMRINLKVSFREFCVTIHVYYNILGTKILPQSVANFAEVLVRNSASPD